MGGGTERTQRGIQNSTSKTLKLVELYVVSGGLRGIADGPQNPISAKQVAVWLLREEDVCEVAPESKIHVSELKTDLTGERKRHTDGCGRINLMLYMQCCSNQLSLQVSQQMP